MSNPVEYYMLQQRRRDEQLQNIFNMALQAYQTRRREGEQQTQNQLEERRTSATERGLGLEERGLGLREKEFDWRTSQVDTPEIPEHIKRNFPDTSQGLRDYDVWKANLHRTEPAKPEDPMVGYSSIAKDVVDKLNTQLIEARRLATPKNPVPSYLEKNYLKARDIWGKIKSQKATQQDVDKLMELNAEGFSAPQITDTSSLRWNKSSSPLSNTAAIIEYVKLKKSYPNLTFYEFMKSYRAVNK